MGRPGNKLSKNLVIAGMDADPRSLFGAQLVPAGSDIVLNLHYTPNGKAVTDHVRIGIADALASSSPFGR
jgi:hypothetical protein